MVLLEIQWFLPAGLKVALVQAQMREDKIGPLPTPACWNIFEDLSEGCLLEVGMTPFEPLSAAGLDLFKHRAIFWWPTKTGSRINTAMKPLASHFQMMVGHWP